MAISLINSTGEELKLPTKAAREFFSCPKGINKVMCLPCSDKIEPQGEAAMTKIYEIKNIKRKKKMAGTVVIRMGGVGDLLMLSSGLRELKRRGELLTLATIPENMAFLKALDIGNVISIEDLGRYEFERVRDLRFAVEPKEMGSICKSDWATYTTKDRSDAFDELLGVAPARKRFLIPKVTVPPTLLKEIYPYEKGGFILVNGSMGASARAIIIKYLVPLCKKLVKLTGGMPVVLMGTSQNWNHEVVKNISVPGVVNVIDKTNTEEMIALCSLASLVITPDTGTLHIAAALKKKTLALFGNINPRTRISYYSTVHALYPQGELHCIPCWDTHPCISKAGEQTKCMKLLTPDRVVNAAKEVGGF